MNDREKETLDAAQGQGQRYMAYRRWKEHVYSTVKGESIARGDVTVGVGEKRMKVTESLLARQCVPHGEPR